MDVQVLVKLCRILLFPYLKLLSTVSYSPPPFLYFVQFVFIVLFFLVVVSLRGLSNPNVHATPVPRYTV